MTEYRNQWKRQKKRKIFENKQLNMGETSKYNKIVLILKLELKKRKKREDKWEKMYIYFKKNIEKNK